MENFYITAAIDYPNAAPHLGTTYEKIGCDVVARYHAMRGFNVRFTMGSDEHSQSVERETRRLGIDPDTFCIEQAKVFQNTWTSMDIIPTAYVRTHSDDNRRTAEWWMDTLYKEGYIYKGLYKAWFCPSCEQFYTEKQIVNNRCPVHDSKLEWVEEENYFFKLSSFQNQLLELFEENRNFLTPATRRNEIINVLKGGLEDISVSRGFSNWGFPLTFDPSQVAYVWLDALPAYLTGIGFPDGKYQNFWPADVHVIGKDITRFHTIMWPAMLMAAKLPLPKRVHAHGFITLGGQRMSKTKGIFVDPKSLVAQYGSDAVRYVLMAEIPFDRDGDFSIELFIERYNADLANDYGNLVSRTEKMVKKYFQGKVPSPSGENELDRSVSEVAARIVDRYEKAMQELAISEAIVQAQQLVARANKYIEEVAPWKLAAENDPRLGTVCYQLLEAIRVATLMLHPIIPRATLAVAKDLAIGLDQAVVHAMSSWGILVPDSQVQVGEILFPRLQVSEILGAS